jgi:DNA-binding response OmpR family regulator
MQLLLVEDEDKLADVLDRALRGQGHNVDVASRGDIAVRMAAGTSYDAIILDVMLPGLNGMEVCRRIRAGGCGSAIIMLTARAGVDDRVAGLDSGADDYLTKPFALKELYARLRAAERRAYRGQRRPVLQRGGRPDPSPARQGGPPVRQGQHRDASRVGIPLQV